MNNRSNELLKICTLLQMGLSRICHWLKDSKGIFIMFIFLLLGIFTFAQSYSYKHYTILDGLVQNQVTTLYQDYQGFIWVGTKAGASRFDGITFKNYTQQEGLAPGLVTGFFEDEEKNLFCITDNGYSILQNGNFKIVHIFNDKEIKYCHGPFCTKDKTCFILAFGYELYKCNKSKFELYYRFELKTEINEYYQNNEGREFVNTDSGFYEIYKNRQFSKLFYQKPIGLKNCKNGSYIVVDGDNIKNKYPRGVYFLNNNLTTKIWKDTSKSLCNAFSVLNDTNILIASNFDEWLILDKNGHKIDGDKNKDFVLITSFLEDKEGNIWIGDESGLFRLQSFAFRNYNEASGLEKYIWTILEAPDSTIFFASFGGKLMKLKDDKIERVIGYERFLNSGTQFYMGGTRTANGHLLFPVNNGTILDYYNGNFKELMQLKENNHAPAILYIYEDVVRNIIYFGTTRGLFAFNNSDGTISKYNTEDKNILSIGKDKFNRLWICTSKKVFLFNGHEFEDFNKNEISYDKGARCCTMDSRENMWLGNMDGLYLYSYQKCTRIFNTPIFFIKEYKKNFIIAGTITGFYYINLDKFYLNKRPYYIFFDRFNGFSGIECGQNGTCMDSKGNVWSPTSDRVVKFAPYRLKENTFAPRIKVYSFEISGKDLKWESILNEYSDIKKTIELTYDKHNIKISYMGISLSCPEKVKFKTRLVGYENSWSEPSGDLMAVYTNLDPGKYIFEIEACNSDGIWTEAPLQIKFTIHPAFWQTWWFYFGIALIILALILLAFRIRLKRLSKKARLKQKMAQLEMDLLHMQIEPHFIGNSMVMIKDLIYQKKYENALEAVDRFGEMLKFVAETTRERFITLEKELLILKNYINFQKLKPENTIEFIINIAPNINVSEILIPPILLQPFVENSIAHGLRHKKGAGQIQIDINNDLENSDYIIISIIDNGIGRKNVIKFETDKVKHKSVGIQNSTERLKNFNNSSYKDIAIIDKEVGTEVKIWLKKEA